MDTVDSNSSRRNGSWVQFSDPSQSSMSNGINLSDVRVTLPPPPRKGEVTRLSPVPEVGSNQVNNGHIPPVLPPLLTTELQNLERVQRILSSTNVLPDFQADADSTVQIDEYENGKILTVLKATNERCAWITPPVYHPEMVPQKVLNFIQMPVEDYVASLTLLVKDYRFRIHAVFYKRVIGIWLFICMIALLAILFSGLRSINLFAAGLLWLFFAAGGMFLCLYGKRRPSYQIFIQMNDGLRQLVASTNKFMTQQRLIVGVDDRGKMSMHKVVVAIIHFDVMPCLAKIAQQLEEMRLTNARHEASITVTFSGQTNLESVNTAPMDKAEYLLLRCLQSYVKELVRKRLSFNTAKIEDNSLDDVRPNMDELPPATPRHCQQHWCICQFVDRMVLRRKPKKWYQKIWAEATF